MLQIPNVLVLLRKIKSKFGRIEKEGNIMSKFVKREERNLKFETLQIHVGQEQPDPATGSRAVPI